MSEIEKEEGELAESGEDEAFIALESSVSATPNETLTSLDDTIDSKRLSKKHQNQQNTQKKKPQQQERRESGNFQPMNFFNMEPIDTSKSRRFSASNTFNEVSNNSSKQKFRGQRSRTNSRPDTPSSFGFNSYVSANHQQPSGSPYESPWRYNSFLPSQGPPLNHHPRRPLLSTPMTHPSVYSSQSRFFASTHYSFPNSLESTMFNSGVTPSIEPASVNNVVESRQSEDMEISPIESTCQTPNIFQNSGVGDEPLDENSSNFLASTSHQHNQPGPSSTASNQRFERSKSDEIKRQKKLQQRLRCVLLNGLSDEAPSQSSSESEKDEMDVEELHKKIDFHNEQLQNEILRREEISKQMNSCDMMITHHHERMNSYLKELSDASRKSVRTVLKSRDKAKTKEQNKRKRLLESFKDRVNSLLDDSSWLFSEISKTLMTENSPITGNVLLAADEDAFSKLVAQGLSQTFPNNDSTVSTATKQNFSSKVSTTIGTSKRRGSYKIDLNYQKKLVGRMCTRSKGITKVPIEVLPAVKIASAYEILTHRPSASTGEENVEKFSEVTISTDIVASGSDESDTLSSNDIASSAPPSPVDLVPNVEKEEALRRKLLETMKNKLTPKVFTKEMEPVSAVTENSDDDVQVIKVFLNASGDVQSTLKKEVTASSQADNEQMADVKPLRCPTMEQIIEMKALMLEKKRKKAFSKKDQMEKESNSSILNMPSVADSQPEKENIATPIIRQNKRPSAFFENDSAKRAKSIPEEKSASLMEAEKNDHQLLFNSPRVAIRNFILDSQFPIRESIERLRCRHDPDIAMCYFELFGICNDAACLLLHEKKGPNHYRLSDVQIVEEILEYIPDRKARKESITSQAQKLLEKTSIEEVIEILRKEAANLDLLKLAMEKQAVQG